MFHPTSRNGAGKNSKCPDSQWMLTRPNQAMQRTADLPMFNLKYS
jgi:hypothetical protein